MAADENHETKKTLKRTVSLPEHLYKPRPYHPMFNPDRFEPMSALWSGNQGSSFAHSHRVAVCSVAYRAFIIQEY